MSEDVEDIGVTTPVIIDAVEMKDFAFDLSCSYFKI
jgi:hypothetical protein